MENAIVDLFQLNETSDMSIGSSENNSTYTSCIKIHGKPILPPLLDEEKRNELRKYKMKAIEIELKLLKQKNGGRNQIPSEISSITTLQPSQQSTPARPISLNLGKKNLGKTYLISRSSTEGSLNMYVNQLQSSYKTDTSQRCSKKSQKIVRSTLEQRIAMMDNVSVKNKLNKCQSSPNEQLDYPDKSFHSDVSRETNFGRWSPLKVEPLNSLRIELTSKDSHETDDVLEISQEGGNQLTPETVTESPNLLRQNSYTLLTPSPALLSFLETQKRDTNLDRCSSPGRKNWDANGTKEKWDSMGEEKNGAETLNGDDYSDEIEAMDRKSSSSVDDFSALENSCRAMDQNNSPGEEISPENYSGTSMDSYDRNKNISKPMKVKCKVKVKKPRLLKHVPSPKSVEKVPFRSERKGCRSHVSPDVPSEIRMELSELSSLLLKMKVNHERQKKELESKQQSEMKQLEIIFQEREAQLLSNTGRFAKKCKKSIYSESFKEAAPKEFDKRVMGDGNHTRGGLDKSYSLDGVVQSRRPQSAKDFHHGDNSLKEDECNRRTKSMDFNDGTQDTDLDISFQDDFMHSRDTTLNNEYILESDSISNFSSRSSTLSSDNRPDLISSNIAFRKYEDITSDEYRKYNQAATVITAAARGFLIRRLLRTAHVQGLITTLKDAITCATQLHMASDIADSDIDLMRRLGRQIEAAWDAVYVVFFNTETSTKLQLIAADRERLKAAIAKTPVSETNKKRISSATRKSLDRKKAGSIMSKSQTSNGSTRVRMCTKLTASYPSPYFSHKFN